MVIGVRSWELHLAGAHSLKDKRSVIKSLKDRLRQSFNVSVAETDHQESWQRAELTACCVAADRGQADRLMEEMDRFVEANPFLRIVGVHDQRL